MNTKTKTLTLIAMYAAMAYVTGAIFRIPVVLFLSYEPKDVIITLSGLTMNPIVPLIVSVIVSLLELATISTTGIIGCLMNIISSCAFACTASIIYHKKRSIYGAAIGLLCGALVMVAAMLLWNYAITPLYMGVPRAAVVDLLLPAFLPFNLLKGGLNAAFTFLLYKPVVTALRKTTLLPKSKTAHKNRFNPVLIGVSIAVIVTCVLFILAFRGII